MMKSLSFSAAVLATSLFVIVPVHVPASHAAGKDDAFLKSLAGSWKGRGSVRRSAKSKSERVSCRLNASWSGRLHMNYSCRGIDVNFSASGTVANRGNRIVGSWSAAGASLSSSVGRRSGNSVYMTLTGRDPKTGKTVRSSFSLRLSGKSRMTNTLNTRDASGKRFRAFSVTMRR